MRDDRSLRHPAPIEGMEITAVWSPTRPRPPQFGRLPFPLDETSVVPPPAVRQPYRAVPWEPIHDELLLTVEYSYTRGELQPVLKAIRDTLGCGADHLDTPARLQEALAALIRSVSGAGDPSVRCDPGALLKPETWHIRLDATDGRTLATLADVVGRRVAQ